MEYSFKKILVAADASENAVRAIRYVGEITAGNPDFNVTLLNVVRNPSRDHFSSDEEWQKGCEVVEQKGREVLEQGVQVLESYGLSRDNIHTHTVKAEGTSIAAEIMKVQQEGGYGTVAVGRRGVSKAEEFLFGSVSNKVVHYARHCTVWVVE